jgi:MoaA/NifB/PqqE/SkfB family radical SAM enzyme
MKQGLKTTPGSVRIEATSRCQLKCPTCPTASGQTFTVLRKGYLTAADFKAFLTANPDVREVELSNFGEMFLNPELLLIMKEAVNFSVRLKADNGVNLNHTTRDVLEGLVKYRFQSLSCSIDGATNETYSQYRVNGNLDRIIEHIKEINNYKRMYESEYPKLTWQFIAFGHNEHEINDAKILAQSLNMKFRLKLNWGDFSPVRQADIVRQASPLGVASRAEFNDKFDRGYLGLGCLQLWHNPQINWDGLLLGCCQNYWGDFGVNVFSSGLKEAMQSERIAYAREMLQGDAPARDDIPCTTCHVYKLMRSKQSWLKL